MFGNSCAAVVLQPILTEKLSGGGLLIHPDLSAQIVFTARSPLPCLASVVRTTDQTSIHSVKYQPKSVRREVGASYLSDQSLILLLSVRMIEAPNHRDLNFSAESAVERLRQHIFKRPLGDHMIAAHENPVSVHFRVWIKLSLSSCSYSNGFLRLLPATTE